MGEGEGGKGGDGGPGGGGDDEGLDGGGDEGCDGGGDEGCDGGGLRRLYGYLFIDIKKSKRKNTTTRKKR